MDKNYEVNNTENKIPSNSLSLKEWDKELYDLVVEEEYRQYSGLELIASENYTSRAVMECLGSCLTNKYSEGTVGARYYGGNQFIDEIEKLCMKRALQAYDLDSKKWGVNVQPYSGSPANLEAFAALLNPGDKIMGLDLPSGGHLTHGYQTEQKKISFTSLIYNSRPYKVDPETGLLNYEEIKKNVLEFQPKLIIVGHSAYPRDLDYKLFREMADSVGAYLLADMAHYSGLVSAKLHNNPFEYSDVVTTTTHKTMRGPRAGMIFYKLEYKQKIDFSVFPSLQGGPHNNSIAAIATQLKELCSDEWKEYASQIIANAQHLAKCLVDKYYKLATGGTDNHLILLDVRPHGLTGNKVEKACDIAQITLNKNAIYGDKSALAPGGVRIGTPAVTTRGMKEPEMEKIADFIDRVIKICIRVQEKSGKNLKDFLPALEKDEELIEVRNEVEKFATQFIVPGIDTEKFREYKKK
jgi:glycine hydroxymethyltransferase